jgi:sterol desaturase/sphingolipid hydroxylase (fatty acid hydroxylase superfamily)
MLNSIFDYFSSNKIILYSTPFYILLIALESYLSNKQGKNFYTLKDAVINLWLNIANTLVALSFKGLILILFSFIYSFHFLEITNSTIYWTFLFFALDFCFYWEHRAEHYVRILWAVHVTHHSSQEFNLTTGFRSSVFRPLVSCWFFLPLLLLGFNPLDILFMDAICQIYGIIVHTRFIKKMPQWFDDYFVSPSHHRVHHASNIIYLDKNMGMVLIIWDRLFGTFQEELNNEKIVYGLTKNPEKPFHPIQIIFHEWQQIFIDLKNKPISIKTKLKYLIMPPGWSHDGSSKTAHELRKELNNN